MEEYDDDYGDDGDEWLYVEDYFDEAVRGFYPNPLSTSPQTRCSLDWDSSIHRITPC